MAEGEKGSLEESLRGYKEKIVPVTKATLTWAGADLAFVGMTQEGYEIEFDANVQAGCKPTDALLLALAGCMGIDVVMFLQKMRMKLASFRLDVVGERNPTPPQYFKAAEIVMHLAGEGLDTKKIDRAVSLSREKYCSVYNSLRKDLELKVRYVVDAKA